MPDQTNTLAVILARAGSKGLPGKNARTLKGKPLLAWTLEHAKNAKCLDKIVLSTDGPALAEIANHHDIEVVHRPDSLATDDARVQDAVRHAVKQVEHNGPATFNCIVILYGNIPLRPVDLTDRAVEKLSQTNADSVQSVCPVGKMHPYWMKKLTGENQDAMTPYQPNDIYRRQDLPPVFMLDGGIIAVTRDALMNTQNDEHPHSFLGKDRRAIITEPGQVVDVDSALDLALADAILTSAERRGQAPFSSQD